MIAFILITIAAIGGPHMITSFELQRGVPYSDVVFSHDGSRLATNSHLWDTRKWTIVAALTPEEKGFYPAGWSHLMAFSSDGAVLAVGNGGRIIALLDGHTGRRRASLKHPRQSRGMAFIPGGRKIVTACDDGRVRIWSAKSGRLIASERANKIGTSCVAASPDGKVFASGGQDGVVRIWNAVSMRSIKSHEAHSKGVLGIAFSPDGRFLASCSWDSLAAISSARTGEVLAYIREPSWIEIIAFSPGSRHVATYSIGGKSDSVTLWAIHRRKQKWTVERVWQRSGWIYTSSMLVFSPDGKSVVTAERDDLTGDSAYHLADIHTHRSRIRIKAGSTRDVAFSPDGKFLIIRSRRSPEDQNPTMLEIWDPGTGRLLKTLRD